MVVWSSCSSAMKSMARYFFRLRLNMSNCGTFGIFTLTVVAVSVAVAAVAVVVAAVAVAVTAVVAIVVAVIVYMRAALLPGLSDFCYSMSQVRLADT